MAKDRLLPGVFATVHPTWQTPWLSNLVFMVFVGLMAAFVPVSVLGHMTSIGTLLAFVIVCAGVIALRRSEPRTKRSFRAPGVPVTPILGILSCLLMMVSLDGETWLRLIVWLAIGLTVFFAYGRRHSRLTSRRP
jgi:APA family basic amino acid/polyamine antiporter